MRRATTQLNALEKNSTLPLTPTMASAGMSGGASETMRRAAP